MPLSEADTRAKLIDPALHARGWTEDLIRREETAGAVDMLEGKARRRARGRTDYTLRVKVSTESQPVAVALIEAKAEHLPPGHGLEQAKAYGACRRLNVAFVLLVQWAPLRRVRPAERPDNVSTPARRLPDAGRAPCSLRAIHGVQPGGT